MLTDERIAVSSVQANNILIGNAITELEASFVSFPFVII
jgi:hypothetical protein